MLLATLLLGLTACEQQEQKSSGGKSSRQTEQTISASPQESEINDMVALSNVMHGAAGQQPDDAPKDQYGDAYIIGDLGGMPANLPSSIVRFVEYDDSPGWDMEAVRHYHPPVRTYASKLNAFGFTFRATDGALYDRKNPKIIQEYKKNVSGSNKHWVRVSITSGSRYGGNRKWMTSYLADHINPNYPNIPTYWVKTTEHPFGLNLYINPGIEPKTGKPWRENTRSDDIFTLEKDNNVVTYISCSNAGGMQPPCDHHFLLPEDMRIKVQMLYSRNLLPQWQSIEAYVIQHLRSFSKDHQEGK